MNSLNIQSLRELSIKATPGEGQHVYTNPRDDNNWRNNEAFIAAANPAVVLALLDRLALAEAVVEAARTFIEASPGDPDVFPDQAAAWKQYEHRLAAFDADHKGATP